MERMKNNKYQLFLLILNNIHPNCISLTADSQWEAYLNWCKEQENIPHE